jgi:hypothetical protein
VQRIINLLHAGRQFLLTLPLGGASARERLLDLTENKGRAGSYLMTKFIDTPSESFLYICAQSSGV